MHPPPFRFRIQSPFNRVALLVVLLLAGRSVTANETLPKIAGITTAYYHNSHADLVLGRLIEGNNLNGTGEFPKLKLVSLVTDQVPKNDTSRRLAAQHGFPIYPTIAEALTLGTGKLAVDGVLLIAEHGVYPDSETGSMMFPKRRMMAEILQVFERSGRVVPVFCDKHLADNWADAKWIYDQCQRLKVPLMAGSSLPVLWRYPPLDVARGAHLKELVVVSYHRLDIYGFHALEIAQCLAERRAGGETGIQAVQCLDGDVVWEAGRNGIYDRQLLDECLKSFRERPLPPNKTVEELVKKPNLMSIQYRDGFKVSVLTLDGAANEWTVAWRGADGRTESTLFWTQELRPFAHFTQLLNGVEKMMRTQQPSWSVERTLLTSGMLDALLTSRKNGGQKMDTPWLDIRYRSDWNWQQPPPPPPSRKITEQ